MSLRHPVFNSSCHTKSQIELTFENVYQAEKGHAADVGDIQGLQRLLEKDAVKVETHAVVTLLAHTRAQLQSALSIADSARGDLAAVLKEAEDNKASGAEGGWGAMEKLVGIGQALDDALKTVKEQGKRSQDLLSQRLAASESCVMQQHREILALKGSMAVPGDAGAAMGQGVLEASALKEDNLALEGELQGALPFLSLSLSLTLSPSLSLSHTHTRAYLWCCTFPLFVSLSHIP